ncbi:MAG TPA: pyridoxal-phosphate dependent enzyme [Planctomycetota bacterium]|nr:pyridoxal-phosphate dependent enzyme [Planctomycetota bacterium]
MRLYIPALAFPVPIYESIVQAIGRTPMVRLSERMARGLPCEILLKVDALNPGGSVKDRIGLRMIEQAERTGKLKAGGTVIECTSGNTGMGIALAAAAKGYRMIFTIPDKMSQEKVNLLKAFGAKVIVTPSAVPPDDPRNNHEVARRLAQEIPNAFWANQYENPENPAAHYESTGPEIWEDCGGRLDAFVCGIGTGGTITGAGRFLKEKDPKVRVIGVDPVGSVYAEFFRSGRLGEPHPYKVEGIGQDDIPPILDFSVVDEVVPVSDKDSFLTARRLARSEGILCGGSSGTALAAALRVGKGMPRGSRLVVLLPDTGTRYLSKVYNDAWMQENQFAEERGPVNALDVVTAKAGGPGTLVWVGPEATVHDAVGLMKKHEVSQMPVLEKGNVLGSLREDLALELMVSRRNTTEVRVREVMSPPLPVAEPDTPAEELSRLLRGGHPALLVRLGDGEFSILTKFDLLQAIAP